MNLKKLVIGIVILGILVAGYGVIQYLAAAQKARTYYIPGDSYGNRETLKEERAATLPAIFLGAGIIAVGVIINFAIKKDKS